MCETLIQPEFDFEYPNVIYFQKEVVKKKREELCNCVEQTLLSLSQKHLDYNSTKNQDNMPTLNILNKNQKDN